MTPLEDRSSKLTTAQRETLGKIAAGEVRQQRFGYGAWRIVGAQPTVVGRLISLGLAKWGASAGDRMSCELTDVGQPTPSHGADK